jgi:hypothetical protein
MGRGTEATTTLGASVSMKERNKIAELVDQSVAAGARFRSVELSQKAMAPSIQQRF